MRSTGKQPFKPIKPSPAPSPAIMLIDADPPEGDQESDEVDISDKRDYTRGTKVFRQVADEKSEAIKTAPADAVAHDETDETRKPDQDQVDVKDEKQNSKPKPKPQAKKERPTK